MPDQAITATGLRAVLMSMASKGKITFALADEICIALDIDSCSDALAQLKQEIGKEDDSFDEDEEE